MNVLFIASWYPNSTFIYQGIFTKRHAHAIKATGVNVKVIAVTVNKSKKLFENKSVFYIDEAGIETQLIEINSRFNKLISVSTFYLEWLVFKYWKKNMPDFHPDLIHSNVVFPAGIIGHSISKKLNVPHVITEHWSKITHYLSDGINSTKGRAAVSGAKMIMPVSNYLANKMLSFVDDSKITIIANAVDTAIYDYIDHIDDETKIVFACLANWESPKRPDLILEALNKFTLESERKIELKVIGGGSLLNDLKVKIWKFDVSFHNFLQPSEIIEQFKGVDYLLHASEDETFSIILAEAAIMGVPMLVSKRGAMPELVNEKNGVLCENTVQDWLVGIRALTLKKFDRKLISEEMKKIASSEAVGKKYKSVYLRV